MERILKALARLEPRAKKALPLRIKGDHLLMATLESGGLRAVERLVRTLNAKGHRFEPVNPGAGRRWWREELDGPAFEIRVWSTRAVKMAVLHYMPIRVQKLTPAQKRFYDRYMEVGQKAYRDPRSRLSATDRCLLLVGELEADVNNGGFAQYLDNKGRRRARSALAALHSIGAPRTAAMLEQALKPGADLSALDDHFYKAPEDLALLGARHAGLDLPGRKRKARDQAAR